MIELDSISVAAGDFRLENVSFTIPTGQYGILMGKTGCGKTTLLEAICGLNRPLSGRIRLMGKEVTHRKPGERGIGYIPQDTALFSHLSVQDQLAFSLRIRGWDKKTVLERVRELTEALGIGHLLKRKPMGLSGGEVQRVALGRALAFRPRVLCLDEPLSSLDHDTRESMCNLLASIKERMGVTLLHVTHDRNEAARLADVIYRVEDGRVVRVENGSPSATE